MYGMAARFMRIENVSGEPIPKNRKLDAPLRWNSEEFYFDKDEVKVLPEDVARHLWRQARGLKRGAPAPLELGEKSVDLRDFVKSFIGDQDQLKKLVETKKGAKLSIETPGGLMPESGEMIDDIPRDTFTRPESGPDPTGGRVPIVRGG